MTEKVEEISEEEDSAISRLAKAGMISATVAGGVLGGTVAGIPGAMLGQSALEMCVDKSEEGEARRNMIVDNAQHVGDVSQLTLGNIQSNMKNACDRTIECSKDALNNVGTFLKSVCDVIPHSTAYLNSLLLKH